MLTPYGDHSSKMLQRQISTIVRLVACLIILVALTHGIPTSCELTSVEVQKDFDIKRYLGRWYITEGYPQTTSNPDNIYSHHQHTYLDAGNGRYDVFIRGRQAKICTYPKGTLIIPSTSGIPGKLRYWLPSGRVTNYWVLSTDYENYAVVFGYQESLPNQESHDVFSWILVRSITTDLGETENTIINQKLSEVCLQRNQFRRINQEKPECRQCDPSTWTVQPNFQLDRYVGKWNEIAYKPVRPFPVEFAYIDYSHTYRQQPNGTIVNQIVGRNRVDNQCFDKQVTYRLQPTTVPGKLNFFPRQNILPDEYWIIETDYTGYAFVLACKRQPTTEPGLCPFFSSWVWSRQLSIDGFQFIRLKKLFEQYCINEDDFFMTPQDNQCPSDPNGPGKIEVCVKYDKTDVKINQH